jgi:hypothetical protein
MCVVKLRGKTGQPIALPMWQATQRFIKKFANPEGRLFNFIGVLPIFSRTEPMTCVLRENRFQSFVLMP